MPDERSFVKTRADKMGADADKSHVCSPQPGLGAGCALMWLVWFWGAFFQASPQQGPVSGCPEVIPFREKLPKSHCRLWVSGRVAGGIYLSCQLAGSGEVLRTRFNVQIVFTHLMKASVR